MISTVVVREAGTADVAAVAAVRLRFLAERGGRGVDDLDPALVEGNLRFVADGLREAWYRAWLAEDGDEVVGGVGLLLHREPPKLEDLRTLEGTVLSMYVAPQARRQGVARRLLLALHAAAAEAGARRISLRATEDGRPLYEGEGYAAPTNVLELRLP